MGQIRVKMDTEAPSSENSSGPSGSLQDPTILETEDITHSDGHYALSQVRRIAWLGKATYLLSDSAVDN